MNRTASSLFGALLLTAACGGSIAPGSDGAGRTDPEAAGAASGGGGASGGAAASGGGAAPVGAAAPSADATHCCAPDPRPSCCMNYGGTASADGVCGVTCDGMPVSSDPGWRLEEDANGCMRWTNPRPFGRGAGFCGAPTLEPDPDGGVGLPTCPKTWSDARALCDQNTSCAVGGQQCSYPNDGDSPPTPAVMSCEHASQVDGGSSFVWRCGQ